MNLPTAVTVAGDNSQFTSTMAAALHGGRFRAYTSDDMIGAELGGAERPCHEGSGPKGHYTGNTATPNQKPEITQYSAHGTRCARADLRFSQVRFLWYIDFFSMPR